MLRYKTKTRPGLVTLYDIRQETEQVYSYNPGARTGQPPWQRITWTCCMSTTMAKWAAMIIASHLVANWCPRLSLMCTMSNPPWWRSRCVTRPTRPKLWPPVIMHTLPVINDKLYHSTHYAAYYNSDSDVYIPVHYSKTRSVSEWSILTTQEPVRG